MKWNKQLVNQSLCSTLEPLAPYMTRTAYPSKYTGPWHCSHLAGFAALPEATQDAAQPPGEYGNHCCNQPHRTAVVCDRPWPTIRNNMMKNMPNWLFKKHWLLKRCTLPRSPHSQLLMRSKQKRMTNLKSWMEKLTPSKHNWDAFSLRSLNAITTRGPKTTTTEHYSKIQLSPLLKN